MDNNDYNKPINRTNIPRNIGKFHIGRVVLSGEGHNVGHVTGFSKNLYGEILIIVKWCDGNQSPVHHDNITLPAC
jgi:hypothetical protein